MAKKTTVASVAKKRRDRARQAKEDVQVITPEASSSDERSGEYEGDEGAGKESSKQQQVWMPGMPLAEDEQLEPDMSVYMMLQEMQVEWPCLSFDMLRGAGKGETLDFPLEAALVAGTQANRADHNKIMLMRWTNLRKNQDKNLEDEEDESDSDSDGEGDDNDNDEGKNKQTPQLLMRSVSHAEGAGVNRIRSLQRDDGNLVVATWSERGRVFLWEMSDLYRELYGDDPASGARAIVVKRRPLGTAGAHKEEGFAMDWSRREWGNLLSGDCAGNIYWTQINATNGQVHCDGKAFTGHKSSVEDLQWSPSESTVFASSSCDQTIRVWDIRCDPRRAALSVHSHDSDVNVISWNRSVDYLLASGADDGSFKTWDLRTFANQTASASNSYEHTLATPVATFNWHKAAVTSLEWHPTEASVLAVSGADDQISLWDFSVERDAEQADSSSIMDVSVPPQLLFTHHGQHEVKELHWHQQAPGVIVSTAASGFNIFKTISI